MDLQNHSLSIKLWPPSQNTRKVLVERMIKNLSAESIFTQKYGVLGHEEAQEIAKHVEEVSFSVANKHYENEPDGDGGSAVQLYARECSQKLLEALKGPRKATQTDKDLGPEKETLFDISKGQRAFIEAEEAEKLLEPLKEPGNSYTRICFSNRSFGLEAARVAGTVLAAAKSQLKEVDLSDFVAGRPEAEALEVMRIFSEALEGSVLKMLNLSNNALGEKGVRAFEALLKSQSDLEELYLMNDGISEEAARAISELIPSTKSLKVLHFHNNMTGDEGGIAIAEVVRQSPVLEDFRCSSTRIGSEGGVILSEALSSCALLRKLDLRDNMFGVEGGLALSRALSNHKDLREIYLSYLNLENEGTVEIVNVLKEIAQSLEVLELAGNEITVEAAPALASFIESEKRLTELNLSENELKDEGTILIGKALCGHSQLIEVDMNTNMIRRAGARFLAQTLVQMPGFKSLNLNGNFISDEGVDELNEIFKKCPDRLGPLDENDPEGEDDDGEDEEPGEDEDVDDELGSKMKNLEVGSPE